MKKIFYTLAGIACAVVVVQPIPVLGAPIMDETLEMVKNKYIFNGPIYATVTDGETLYLGGEFDEISRRSEIGEAILFDETTKDIQAFPYISTEEGGETVHASISDGNGGWFVGGSFTHINGLPHSRIAHILSDGSVDPKLNPLTVGKIYSLAYDPHKNILYAGGAFGACDGVFDEEEGTCDGEIAMGIAAFNISTGKLADFPVLVDDLVTSLALSSDGSVLYVGGVFSSINESDVFGLGAINTSDGSLVEGVDFNGEYEDRLFPMALALSSNGILYVGNHYQAQFGLGGGLDALFAFDTSDGSQIDFDPNVDGGIYALALSPDEQRLYIGGSFIHVGEKERFQFAEINIATGQATDLDAHIVGEIDTVYAIGLSTDGETIYIGDDGSFTEVGGKSRRYFAEIDAVTGLATDFNPNLGDNVNAIAVSDGKLLVGGAFSGEGESVSRQGIVAIDLSTYELTDFEPEEAPYYVSSLALSPDNSVLYISDTYELIGVSTETGIENGFEVYTDNEMFALAVSSDGTVYAGGFFTEVNDDSSYAYLVALNPENGSAIETFAPQLDSVVFALAFSPNEEVLYASDGNGTIFALNPVNGDKLLTSPVVADGDIISLAVSPDGKTLYAGGDFYEFTSYLIDVGEGFIADAETGAVIGTPYLSTDSHTTVYASISDGNGGWYVGGSFDLVNGEEWNSRIAHILPDGSVDKSFEPSFEWNTNVKALALDGEILYVGGDFDSIGSEDRIGLAAINTTNGSLLSFNPKLNGEVNALELDGKGNLYVGGRFSCVGYDYDVGTCPEGSARNNLASVSISDGKATEFNPNIDGEVFDIDISEDGSVLYVGGAFDYVNGDQERVDFAAFSLDSETLGEVTALDLSLISERDTVLAIAESSDGKTVYIGGYFGIADDEGTLPVIVAVVDVEANGGVGALSEAFPYISQEDGGTEVYALALSEDDSVLYVGGELGENLREGVSAISTADGSLIEEFNANIDDWITVHTISTSQESGTLFIGGEHMYVQAEGGGVRQGVASFDTTDLSLTDFDLDIENLQVYSLAVTSDGEQLYVGGGVYDDDTGSVYPYLASFDTRTGEITFAPELKVFMEKSLLLLFRCHQTTMSFT